MAQPRSCTVSFRDPDGVVHTVKVQAESLFEAAARAVMAFREQGWAVAGLTPSAMLRVEVHLPAVVHEVPMRAVERWLQGPSDSPRAELVKRQAGKR